MASSITCYKNDVKSCLGVQVWLDRFFVDSKPKMEYWKSIELVSAYLGNRLNNDTQIWEENAEVPA